MTLEHFLLLLSGIPYTLAITAGGLVIGAVLGFPLLALRVSRFGLLRSIAIMLISVVRSIPPIVWLFLIFFTIGTGIYPISPVAAALIGFGLIATVNLAEIYRGGLVAVHKGQAEAAQALNMTRWQILWDVIFPQMIRVCIPMIGSYSIGLLKDAAIASTIGVPDLTYQGRYITQATYQGLTVMGAVALIYILLSLPVAWLSRKADAYLRLRVAK